MVVYYAKEITSHIDESDGLRHFHAKKVKRVASNFSGDLVVIQADLPDDETTKTEPPEGISDDQ